MSRGAQIFFILYGIAGAMLGLRSAWASIEADEAGVTVTNLVGSTRVSWEEIDRFELGRWGPLPRNGLVCLRDGRRIGVWAISARNPNFRRDPKTDAVIAELNERLAASRA